MADADYALALSLQDEFSALENKETTNSGEKRKRPTSIVDDCWETIDPTPDIRQLFLQFNDMCFDGKLSCCEVKWAPRMTLCAGVCCYEGRGGLCSIKLSMPLLKLRPRRDLVQTLLHEMIHAYLFVTHNNKDHDSHGPEFHKHMSRINKQTGAKITVYHNFHDEVDLYRQHWWRCDGPCKKRPPYYGIVKRAMNRAPSPRDPWWPDHRRTCGGTYHKVREPEDYGKKKRKKEDGASEENKATKGTPKIYDLLKKKSNTSNLTDSSCSSGNTKTSDSKDTANTSKYVGDLSTSTKNIETWRVENDSSSGKENDSERINHAFTPFTGKGHVLGSVRDEASTSSGKSQGKVLKANDFHKGLSTKADHLHDMQSILQDSGGLSSQSGRLNRTETSISSKQKAIDINENDFVNDDMQSILQDNGGLSSQSGRLNRTETSISSKQKAIDINENDFVNNTNDNTGKSLSITHGQRSLERKSSAGFNVKFLNRNEDLSKDTQAKKNVETQLTIVDAFKNVGGKSVPLVFVDDTTTDLALVECPVCLVKIKENLVNAHLDTCLS